MLGTALGLGLGLPYRLGAGTTPLSLFTGGVAGAWYDPSDLTTLFQDSAGTTPVTAVEQVVGLMLDKSQGLVLGSEAVISPYTGSTSGTWAISATSVTRNSSASGQANLTLNLTPDTNTRYVVSFTVANLSGDTFFFRLGSGGAANQVTANGTYTARVLGGGGSTTLIFAPWAGGAGEVTITNISVKALPGYHATATGTARPTLSARVNLLTKTEEFQDAAWTKQDSTITADTTVAPNGTVTADTIFETAVNGPHYAEPATPVVLTNGLSYTISTAAKANTQSYCFLGLARASSSAAASVEFDLVNGTVNRTFASGTGWASSGSVTNLGNGWFRVTATITVGTSSTSENRAFWGTSDGTAALDGRGRPSYAGNVSNGIYIWGADLRVSNDGVNIPPYQRVNTATDYDTAGFPLYLSFAGAQAMSTPASIPFATVTSDGQARRNLFSNPTQFDVSASWPVTRASVTANATTAPDGSSSADKIVEDTTASATHSIQYVPGTVGTIGAQETLSVYAKPDGRNWILLQLGSSNLAYFDVSTGAVGTISGSTVATISGVGNGWYRCSISAIRAGNQNNIFYCSPANGTITYTGDGTSGLFLWGAQLETGSTATAFQNVGTDKMLVVAGVRKLSDAAAAIVTELSATAFTNNGSLAVSAPGGALNSFFFRSRGTAVSDAEATFAAPTTRIVTGIAEIDTDTNILRVNSVQAATSATDQGTGNYGSYPLYIGARNLASLFFNGRLYGLIVAGSQYTSGQVSATESYMNTKTRAY